MKNVFYKYACSAIAFERVTPYLNAPIFFVFSVKNSSYNTNSLVFYLSKLKKCV